MRRLLALALALASTTLVVPAASPASASVPHQAIGVAPRLGLTAHTYSKSCFNLDCPEGAAGFSDHGGALVSNPVVDIVVFSDQTGTLSPATGLANGVLATNAPNAAGAIDASLSGGYAEWWMSEYGRPDHELNPGGYHETVVLTNPTIADSATVTDTQIAQALKSAVSQGTYSVTGNTIATVFLRAGQIVQTTDGNSATNFCAYHSAVNVGLSTLPYIVMPNQTNDLSCDYAGTSLSDFQNMTPVLSHEITETVTDPAMPGAWMTQGGSEIADVCTQAYDAQPVPYNGATYYLQYLYSLAVDGCFATPVPSNLTTVITSTNVTATLTAQNLPVANQTLTLGGPGMKPLTATTGANGAAVFDLTTPPAPGWAINYAGAGPLLSSKFQSNLLTITGPAANVANQSTTYTATLTPPQAGVTLTLLDASVPVATAVTDANGVANFAVTFTPGPHTLSVTGADAASATVKVIATVPTMLNATWQNETTLTVAVTSSNKPLVGVTVDVRLDGILIVSVLTGSSGVAHFDLPDSAIGRRISVSTSGDAFDAPASLTVQPATTFHLTLRHASRADAAGKVRVYATITPARQGQQVVLNVGRQRYVRTTDAKGRAVFMVKVGSTQRIVLRASAAGAVASTRFTLATR